MLLQALYALLILHSSKQFLFELERSQAGGGEPRANTINQRPPDGLLHGLVKRRVDHSDGSS